MNDETKSTVSKCDESYGQLGRWSFNILRALSVLRDLVVNGFIILQAVSSTQVPFHR